MTKKIYVEDEIRQIFALWLQSRIDLLRDYPNAREYYKNIFNSLGDSCTTTEMDFTFSLFVADLCDAIYRGK